MNIVNRIIMTIWALMLLIFGTITFLLLTGVMVPANQTLRNILRLYATLQALALMRGTQNNTAVIIAVVLALIGLAFLILELWGPVRRLFHGGQAKRYVVRQDAVGQVTVDRTMVRDWVQHEAQSVPGVQHAEAEVKDGQDGLHIFVRTAIAWDADAPAVGAEVQQGIKDSAQTHIGLPVAEVHVATQSAPLVAEPPRRVA